ncbi:MAG: NhaC family Na+:H+ antiporter, partial [Cyclobacteriaceae bacterium]
MPQQKREATLLEASIPIIFLIVLLFINVSVFGDSALDGSNQIVLIFAALVASIMAVRLGYKWYEIREGIVKSITSAMSGILILLLIGSLAGSWMISGIVPAMIYYGLQIINPSIFLFASCLVCAIVSLATGSSWTTSATIGIALVGIGRALDINAGMVAGAVLSGAYFGDKMSPLSDTTNLAPSMAGTNLFTHIRYMAYTTVPSISITLIIFLLLGLSSNSVANMNSTATILATIDSAFYISGWLFLVPVFMVALILKKVAPIPALMAATLLGILFALIFQRDVVQEISGYTGPYWEVMFVGSMKALYGSVAIVTDNEMVNELLSSGGMAGML